MKQIETERLKMREIDLADAEGFFELDSNHSCGLQKNSHYIAAVAFIFIRSTLSLKLIKGKTDREKSLPKKAFIFFKVKEISLTFVESEIRVTSFLAFLHHPLEALEAFHLLPLHQ